MKKQIEPLHFATVCSALIGSGCRSAVKYLDEKTVVRATWRRKPSGSHTREEAVVTFGAPNYLERLFIKKAKKAGEPFPIKKIQLRAYPVKKGAKK